MSQNEYRFDKDDGIIYFSYRGDQTSESVTQFKDETDRDIAWLKAAGKPVLMLIDVTELKKISSPARQAAVNLMGNTGDKLAVVGASLFLRSMAKLVATALGIQTKISNFDSQEEARIWLKSDKE
jgi:hypothetical protein